MGIGPSLRERCRIDRAGSVIYPLAPCLHQRLATGTAGAQGAPGMDSQAIVATDEVFLPVWVELMKGDRILIGSLELRVNEFQRDVANAGDHSVARAMDMSRLDVAAKVAGTDTLIWFRYEPDDVDQQEVREARRARGMVCTEETGLKPYDVIEVVGKKWTVVAVKERYVDLEVAEVEWQETMSARFGERVME